MRRKFKVEKSSVPILKVETIRKTYQNGDQTITALEDISFELAKGEILAIMGSSGSGKSTMLNILGALDEPDSGKIYLEGEYKEEYSKEPFATEMRKNYIGFVFQNFSLLQDLSVRENVELPLILQGSSVKQSRKEVEEIVEMIGLKEKTDSDIRNLSGGQQQRVAIARAVITKPRILLADEPTGNLDFNTSKEIMELFLKLREQIQQSIIIVTHDPVIASYADRILFFHDGRKKVEYQNVENQDNFSNILEIFQNLEGV